jgi:hypothetical protein
MQRSMARGEVCPVSTLYSQRGRISAWIVGRRVVRQDNALAMERSLPSWSGTGPSGVRPLLHFSVRPNRLASVSSICLRELQRNAQSRRLVGFYRPGLVSAPEVSLDSMRLGVPHPLRYSHARTLVLPDSLSVAVSNPAGQRYALGTTCNHDSELHCTRGGLHTDDWPAQPATKGERRAQNYWGRRHDTVDSLGLRGRIGKCN